jgi:hypothetical protein
MASNPGGNATVVGTYVAHLWSGFGGSAAGSNTQIQYNNNGILGASSALTFNGTTLATTTVSATTISATTISDGTNSTSSTNCIKGSAKAWVNFDGATPTVRASYNVTSVTRASAGFYTVTFTNAFSDTNYAVVGSAGNSGNSNYTVVGVYTPSNSSYSNKTTTACAISAYAPSVPNYDPYEIDIAFFR